MFRQALTCVRATSLRSRSPKRTNMIWSAALSTRQPANTQHRLHRVTRFSLKDKPNISASDRFAYLLASGFGAGFFPVGPGTVGSLEAVAIFLALAVLRLDHSQFVFAMI